MSDETFRPAVLGDLPAIVALLADDPLGATREDASLPPAAPYLRGFEALDRNPDQLLAVAEADGAIIGTLQLSFLPGIARMGAWRGQIEAVRVARDQRGTGLGARMVDWAVGECRARGCTLVQLTTDKTRPDAHRFYERLGFRATHEGFKLAL